MASLQAIRSVEALSFPTVVSHGLSESHSDDYDWSDVHLAPFEIHGLIAIRAPDKTPKFNLAQHAMLPQRGNLSMNWQRSYGPAVENLSFAILYFYSSLLDHRINSSFFYRPAKFRNVSIVQAFGLDCLCSMPRAGGRIPLSAMTDWWTDNVRT